MDAIDRLLLLEDDAALRQMLAWELSELGYEVCAVGSCAEARVAMAANNFQLGLFDVGLPDGNGADLAAEFSRLRPGMRILLCSGRPDALDRDRPSSNVLASLTKPVSIARVQSLFRARESEQSIRESLSQCDEPCRSMR